MYALFLLAAAGLASAQPLPAPSGTAVGPLQNPAPSDGRMSDEELVYRDQSVKPLKFDMSDVSDGAELKVQAAKLKLKVPI